jgi:Ca-activated chloride channel family protein
MFTIKTYQNKHLRLNQTNMKALLSIMVDPDTQVPPMPLALGIALDRSASMQGARLSAALGGAIKVVQALDETVTFMVVVFEARAQIVFGPATGTPRNKQHAIQAIQSVSATGGTAMSTALDTIVDTFGNDPTRATKILFLTDGKNETEQRQRLDEAVARCSAANIAIHAWGVGTDWDSAELRSLAQVTRGDAGIIPTPQEIEAHFTASIKEIRKTALSRVHCVFWSPPGVTITTVLQVHPTLLPLRLEPDVTNHLQQSVQLGSLNLGEQRDYLINLVVTPPKQPGQQFVMIRPSLRYVAAGMGEQEVKADKTAWVYAEWTDIIALAAQTESHIAHYITEGDLAQYIEDGQKALDRGDVKTAEHAFGLALEISERACNERITALLSDILEKDTDGIMRLNPKADPVTRKKLEMSVGRTVKVSDCE